jgi:hypothetical protein
MTLARAALAAILLLGGAAFAEPWSVGGKLPPLALSDQHGKAVAIDPSVRVLIFSREMTGGGIVKQALATDGAEFLQAHRAVYVSDVSRMPAVIRNTFALPALRRRDYRIALDESGEVTRDIPSVEGKPTLLVLDAGTIVSIADPSSAEELREAVAAASIH